MNKKSRTDIDSESSWEIALRYSRLITTIPDTIAFAIKALRRNHVELLSGGTDRIEPSSFAAVRLLDSIKSLKTPLFFAAARLYPERFKTAEDDTSRALLKVLGPGLFSSLLTVIYFYRRIQKFSDPDVWNIYSREFLKILEVGFLLGEAVPEMGPTETVLMAAIRPISIGAFLIKDKDSYTRYFNRFKGDLDINFEHERWGCDHSQVAYYITRKLGYYGERLPGYSGSRSPYDVRQALLGNFQGEPDDTGLKIWASSIYWLDSLKRGSESAEKLGDFTVTQKDFDALVEATERVYQKGSSFDWLNLRYREFDEEVAKEHENLESPRRVALIEELKRVGYKEEELEPLSLKELEDLRDLTEHYSE
ncbi:MAG: hypothetical protein D6719_09890 [Candidatus Dadabacteria bacterium]|nr:MAG: hypothetical protein D6719_09890 [Candidatus Dadabacteria bacterium]